MGWYRTGTVAVTNGSPNVTGTGTAFVNKVDPGEGFVGPDGKTYEILSITSDTAMVLATNYAGATASGQVYQVAPIRGRINDLVAEVNALIAQYGTIADDMANGSFGAGTVALPGINFSVDQDTGFYRSAANELSITTGGAQRFFINADYAKFNLNGGASIISPSNANGWLQLKNTVGDWSIGMFGVPGWERFSILENSSGLERLTVLKNGSVGINTSTPNSLAKLEVFGGNVRIAGTGANGSLLDIVPNATGTNGVVFNVSYYGSGGYGPMVFATSGTEQARIAANGNSGFGTSNPLAKMHVNAGSVGATGAADVLRLSQNGDGGVTVKFANAVAELGMITAGVTSTGAGTDDGYIAFSTTANGVEAEHLRIGSNGGILYTTGRASTDTGADLTIGRTSSGAGIQNGPNITLVDGTTNNTIALQNGAGDFQIWNYGAAAWNARVTVKKTGEMYIGDPSVIVGSGKLRVQRHSDGYCYNSWHSADYTAFQFVRGGSEIGTITVDASAVHYNTTSDYRLKVIYEDVANPGAIIDAVPVHSGHYIADEAETPRHLFLAHEVQDQVPYAVHGEKDGEAMQQLDAMSLIPIMWAEIRSLRARLEAHGIA